MASYGSLQELADAAGAGSDITRYLELRGIKAIATLALIAKDDDSFQRNLVQPLFAGFTKSGDTVRVPEDERPIAEAVLKHMWTEAKLWWVRRQAQLTPGPAVPAGALPTASQALMTGANTTPLATDKIPKTLPANVWSQQVSKYNSIQVNGRDRVFPEAMLLGAESVLARIYHEHHVSKLYTPTRLGEILAKRSFTATGEVNPLATQQKKSAPLVLEDSVLVQEDEKLWSPRSVLSIMDGLQAVTWAYILLEVGEEHHLHAYCDWCIAKARNRPQKLEQFKQWWEAASWRIAMKMRNGSTFGEASAEVMADVDLYNDHMSREVVKDTSPAGKREPKKRPAPAAPDSDPGRSQRQRTWQQPAKGGKGNGPRKNDRAWGSSPWGESKRYYNWWSEPSAEAGKKESKDG